MRLVCDCDEKPAPYARYYDTPDGCDVETKAIVCARYGALVGAAIAFYDINMFSHSVGFKSVIKRLLFHTVPLSLMGVTFAVVANSVLQLRNVDDELNYFIGGIAASPIAAAYIGHPMAIIPCAVALGTGAVIKKMAIDADMCIFPKIVSHMGMVDSIRRDYTLVKDPKDELTKKCQQLVDKYREEIRRRRSGYDEDSAASVAREDAECEKILNEK